MLRPSAARPAAILAVALFAILDLLIAAPAMGHDPSITPIEVHVDRSGRIVLECTTNLDGWIFDSPDSAEHASLRARVEGMDEIARSAAIEALRERMRSMVALVVDGTPIDLTASFPLPGSGLPHQEDSEAYLGWTVRLDGPLPAGAHAFTLRCDPALRIIHLAASVPGPGGEPAHVQQIVEPGEASAPISLHGDQAPTGSIAVLRQFLWLGFEHIIPLGLDHILFVLGLFLLSARLKPLLWQVTAFTVAHSITLALSIYGVVQLSPRVVEPLIALSIAYVAIENMVTDRLTPWRPIVVFLFGLLHGLGFAGVLTELGLPRDQFVPALVAFNVGVELGQLAVIAGAFLTIGWFRNKPWYRTRIVLPLSLIIALVGGYWAVERTLGD